MNAYVKTLPIIAMFLLASCQPEPTEMHEQSAMMQTYNSLSPQAKSLYYKQTNGLTQQVPERMAELDSREIGCFGPGSIMQMPTTQGNLGGQCCGALTDFDAYELQLTALHEFIEENGNLVFIPKDPYDIPVESAQLLTSWDSEITLEAEQQKIYDTAMGMSHHGGPCCCKCWKWYMMSGLAKKLIADHGWDEHQIAQLWDISSSCGHAEDTNMSQHYSAHDQHD